MIPTGSGSSPAAETARRSSEKAQIQDIKERFSNYIRNVKSMRNQLKQGGNTSVVKHLQEEMITIRNLYENEVGELREKLERSYQDGNRDGISGLPSNLMAAEYQSRLFEMSRDILQKDEEIQALQLVVAQQESDIQSMKGAAIAPSIQLDLTKQEMRELQGNLIMAQTKYEEEFSQRLSLQDQLRELTYHTDNLKQIHMKETQGLRAQVAQSQVLVLQLEDKLRSISRGGPALVEAVQRIQEASEAEVKRLQNETESVYNQNLLELQMRLNNDQILLGQAQADNQRLHQRVEDLTSEVTALEKKLFEEGTNSRTVMEKLEAEHVKGLQHIRGLEARLEELQDLLLAKMKELNTFQESNVSLRSELDALKSMLEEEERQMGISNLSFPQTLSSNQLAESFHASVHKVIPEYYKATDIFPPITKSYSTELCTATSTEESLFKGGNLVPVENTQDQIDHVKRSASAPLLPFQMLSQRHGSSGSMMDSATPKSISKTPPLSRNSKTAAVSSALGYLEIFEIDPSGNFVKIINQSLDKEEDIGGCLLQQNIRGHPVLIYRFPVKTRVMARCMVTVWASSAGIAHNPPTDFLFKEQSKFVTEPRCTTILCTPNGKALAWFTPLKNKMTKSVKKSLLQLEPISLGHATEQQKEDREPATGRDVLSSESLPAYLKLEKMPVLLKREKISPTVLPVTSSPWTQSTTSPTHPDFTPSRFVPLRNGLNSQCPQTRLSAPSSGVHRSRHGRETAISPVSKKSRGPTRSAGPNSRGVLYLGYSAPTGSVLHKFFANPSYNIRLASHVSLTPTILSSY
ncbi:lamin tail domain-containing protein 1 [Mantella aurantiaca]